MSGIQSLDQRRAAHAWTALQGFADQHAPKNAKGVRVPTDKGKKYGVHVRKLPMRVMASGLGQALAFLLAKDYCPDLLAALGDWVLDKRSNPVSKAPPPEPKKLLHDLIGGDSEFAQLATAETLAYLRWLTRFAEAEGLTGVEED
ncbi:MAG TPA: type III-B CRISPR module-associated protein Cmr5 [Urbifossiella sp.]|jgi:CRISPR-associated protein Cmr5|nr:type III-B CRISPR module-associated protein Cmr5 [Urbifossiella sp.]